MNKIILAVMALALINCGRNQEESSGVTETAAVVESATSVLSGIADDQAGESLAKADSKIINLLFPKAYASACLRPYFASCMNGVKTESYDSCDVYRGSLSGSASLTYSDVSCDMSNPGDSVVRSYNVNVTGPRGGVFKISSDVAQDYNGNSYGGGGQLTKTVSGFDMEILGKHKSFTNRRGNEIYNVSMRTLQPIQVTGGLARGSRALSGGELEVNHNKAQFTAVFVPTDLQWSNTCCHPVSGSLAVTYSGSKSGSAIVTFQGCGAAELNQDGQTENIELSYCE